MLKTILLLRKSILYLRTNHLLTLSFKGGFPSMRNKAKNFPIGNRLSGEQTRAKAEFASTRADGSINTHPQERMHASSHRNKEQ